MRQSDLELLTEIANLSNQVLRIEEVPLPRFRQGRNTHLTG